jgi:uncharacterized membrane protein YeaQ/YmgE (transglycosylase-associated protein family)
MKTHSSTVVSNLLKSLACVVALAGGCIIGGQELCAAESVGDKVGAAADSAGQAVTDTAQAVESEFQDLWRRIDEQRLKNRTPDQLVAWVIMGLLVGALIHRFSRFKELTTLALGLIGAFLGGIIANVTQLNLGMGPVLIRYEDLVLALAGGVIFVLAAGWISWRRSRGARRE